MVLSSTMLGFVYANVFNLLLFLTAVAAVIWGGWVERVVSALFVTALVASLAVLRFSSVKYLGFETGLFIVDGTLLIALLLVTLRAGQGWLICATSFQAIAVLGHLAKLVNPHYSRMAYWLMANASIYPTVIALAVGIWQYRRRKIAAAAGTSSGTS